MRLDERKRRVLQAVIDDYIVTAEPVGSRTISRKYGFGCSPATIRNEMADLEELGYLSQPHASAGRVPSNKGYRFYVDCLMETRQPGERELGIIRQIHQRKTRELEALLHLIGKLLSETTNYASLVTGPQPRNGQFHSLQVIPLSEGQALLLVVGDGGLLHNRVMDIPDGTSIAELQQMARLLTERLEGLTLDRIGRGVLRTLDLELTRYREIINQTLDILRLWEEDEMEERVYLAGTTNILNQPEFKDVDKVRALLGALEQEQLVSRLLASRESDSLTVAIGEELRIKEMEDCSLVSATYSVGGRVVGRIGVLGPRRMDYSRVVSIVDYLTRTLNDVLQKP